jgi:hypothetical protein
VLVGTSIAVPPPAVGSVLHTLEYWAVDGALNSEEPRVSIFEVWPAETIPPVTTSDATTSYTGSATINLTATDSGGSGVAGTFYRLDGGQQQTGTTVAVSAVGSHTLEYWSVDHSGNTESHKTATFTVSAATGRIYFVWNSPPPGSSASIIVWDWNYKVVYQASSPAWSPPGCFTVTVPVSSKPYRLQASWYDAGADEDGVSSSTVLIDTPGKTATFWY